MIFKVLKRSETRGCEQSKGEKKKDKMSLVCMTTTVRRSNSEYQQGTDDGWQRVTRNIPLLQTHIETLAH